MNTKLKTLVVLGVLVVIIPFLGVPLSWKQWILALLGLGVVWVATLLYMRLPRENNEGRVPTYTENGHDVPETQSEQQSV